jgi:O-acetyl-ADP-ribose deacetylase (regulator of RNase III)
MALESMLRLANDNDIRSLALPAIGTGMFKFPPMLAARIICQAIQRADELAPFLQTVRICLTDADMVQLFESANAEVQTSTVQ